MATDMFRITAKWEGFLGAPGYSNFYFRDPEVGVPYDDAAADVHTFFDGLKGVIAPGITISVQAEVSLMDSTGATPPYVYALQTVPAPVASTTAGTFSAVSGACITWRTGTVVENRIVRGRTFIVPLSSSAYESNGTLTTSAINTLKAAANGLLSSTASDFVVWSRPRATAPGQMAAPLMALVTDQAAVLRSRRR